MKIRTTGIVILSVVLSVAATGSIAAAWQMPGEYSVFLSEAYETGALEEAYDEASWEVYEAGDANGTQDTWEETYETEDYGEEAAAEETAAVEAVPAAPAVEAVPAAPAVEAVPLPAEAEGLYAQARLYAAQYDYDRAIATIQQISQYDQYPQLVQAAADFQAVRDACVEYPLEEITHVFFHTLVVDPAKAFDSDFDSAGFNQVMTTVSEFNRIMQIMYDRGYVLVSPHDMAALDENGVMTRKRIMLPEGKIPFVLSQDDVSYYHYMDGDGFATRLVLDGNGEVKNEYIQDDGTVSVGDYDMVPLLDTFVKEHPDFSYHGRKGILAMTGYDGVLGYRTDTAYQTWEKLDNDQLQFLESHPDFNFEEECSRARAVADAMKANGWEFASHTW